MEFDTTSFRIFDMPPYLFCVGVGFIVALSLYILLLAKKQADVSLYVPRLLLSLPFLIIGAKIFGIINRIIESLYYKEEINLQTFTDTGIVFYGGLLGLLISFLIFCRIKDKHYNKDVMDCISIVIPLFHAFGRFGCFFAGCCYGIETTSWFSVTYTNNIHNAVVTANRLPIQLIESYFNIFLFTVLLTFFLRGYMKGKLLWIYLTTYSLARFFFEFLRGDWNWKITPISGSQITSMVLLISMLIISYYLKRRCIDGKVL